MNKKLLLLIAIVIFAAFLRFFHLSSNPPSLNWDEAAWGYNAYSLSIDGRDEFGRFLPLDYIESFGDFKPPMYAYLSVFPVMLFGMSEFSTRFASAFFGTLTVLITYFLVKQIFYDTKQKEIIALLASFFLAISPWHINLSRGAYEANVATFFIICGVWSFLYAMQNKKWFLILSIASFVASLYTFNTARIVSPLLVVVLGIVFHKKLLEHKKQTLAAGLMGIFLLIPLLPFLLSPQANLRFREVNIFSDITVIERLNQQVANDENTMWSKMLHHRYLAFASEYVRHYIDHFNPSFLFLQGDRNPRFSTQDVGQLLLWELPFFVLGIFYLFRKRPGIWWVVPVWLLIGIVPAATARETPHALRIEAALPTFQIITALGVFWCLLFLKNNKSVQKVKTLAMSIGVLLLGINFLYYFHGYHAFYPTQYASEWQYGYKDAMQYTKSVEDRYETIYFTESFGRPYIYALFYTKYDPRSFRREAGVEREVLGFVHVKNFGKYHFVKEMPDVGVINALYIDTPQNIPEDVTVTQRFLLPNGDTALVAYTK